jgi:hypothetical protein
MDTLGPSSFIPEKVKEDTGYPSSSAAMISSDKRGRRIEGRGKNSTLKQAKRAVRIEDARPSK